MQAAGWLVPSSTGGTSVSPAADTSSSSHQKPPVSAGQHHAPPLSTSSTTSSFIPGSSSSAVPVSTNGGGGVASNNSSGPPFPPPLNPGISRVSQQPAAGDVTNSGQNTAPSPQPVSGTAATTSDALRGVCTAQGGAAGNRGAYQVLTGNAVTTTPGGMTAARGGSLGNTARPGGGLKAKKLDFDFDFEAEAASAAAAAEQRRIHQQQLQAGGFGKKEFVLRCMHQAGTIPHLHTFSSHGGFGRVFGLASVSSISVLLAMLLFFPKFRPMVERSCGCTI